MSVTPLDIKFASLAVIAILFTLGIVVEFRKVMAESRSTRIQRMIARSPGTDFAELAQNFLVRFDRTRDFYERCRLCLIGAAAVAAAIGQAAVVWV